METKKKKIEVGLASLKIGTITISIRGKTPLLMDRMSEEVKHEILAKQTGITKSNKNRVRDTKEETLSAIHYTPSGGIGFPSAGFKKGMMDCTSFVGDKFFSKKLIQGIMIVNADAGLIPIKFKKQIVLEHTIKNNTKFTPQFHDWSCDLTIHYDQNNLGAEDIVRLLNYAGFYVGVGAWRPKGRDGGSGEFGMYEVQTNGKKL